MILVIAQRAPADKQGPDVSDPLLCAVSAAIERGRNEIDRTCSNRRVVAITGPYRQWTAPGLLIEVQGRRETYRGIARRSALTIVRDGDEFKADFSLELEREA